MMRPYQGHFLFTRSTLDNWNSSEKGVYYIGAVDANGILRVHYVGKGCGEYGIRGRLYDHLGKWGDATHFGFAVGSINSVIDAHELAEIRRLSPKYNVVGV